MRYLTLLFLVATVCNALKAQEMPQPTLAFPFDGITLTDMDSSKTLPSEKILKKGKPTVLAFWLTTCGPCQMELAAYSKRYAAWQQELDFQLLAISIDYPERFRQIAVKARTAQWPFPVWWDSGRMFRDVLPGGLNGLPQVFLFDAKGKLVWQHRRYAPGQEALLEEQLRALGTAKKQ